MQTLLLSVIIMEAEIRLLEKKPVELVLDTRMNNKREEIKEVGVLLERINLTMGMIGLIKEAVKEELILKLGVKEM